jgi:hypothetical protein
MLMSKNCAMGATASLQLAANIVDFVIFARHWLSQVSRDQDGTSQAVDALDDIETYADAGARLKSLLVLVEKGDFFPQTCAAKLQTRTATLIKSLFDLIESKYSAIVSSREVKDVEKFSEDSESWFHQLDDLQQDYNLQLEPEIL